MPLPTLDEFRQVLESHTDERVQADYFADLMTPLLTAFEAVMPHKPQSVKLVAPPWSEPALAFEAAWADTRSLVVAARRRPQEGAPVRMTLRRAGQLVQAGGFEYNQVALAVGLCLEHR
ncbi:hypothetical protein [Hymenobacter jejuensis]|uniref:Uncharacterized protein n=1 Tax=Hymenobacter jejuensis TaxID=2502781 RepID=A0A5B8A5E4_9BACT|nr:hypothetical protein [Hymenobacter jejuensis]QDA61825.1 hypothetical protein FHG12_17740 [Hymenobacter jejuensis]